MIRHQAIRVERTSGRSSEVAQVRQEDKTIGVVDKAVLPVDSALTHMHRDTGHDETLQTSHPPLNEVRAGALTTDQNYDPDPELRLLAP